MRVLYHHRTQAADGQAVHIVELQEAFRRAGHELREVALVSHGGGASPDGAKRWKRLVWAVLARVPRFVTELMEYGYNLVAGRALRREIRAFRPNFVYERYSLGTWAGVKAARRAGIPIVLEVNSPMVREMSATRGILFKALARRVERSIFRGADRIAVVSAVLGEILVEIGAPRERLFVTPNGVDPGRYAEPADGAPLRRSWGVGEGDVVLGFVGFYRDWHRLDRVVRALASLPQARFVAVGEGPARAATEELAARLGVADRVHFPGRVDAAQIPRVVAAFDAALVPAINEYASPLKLFDYLAGARAVLAPDQPNLREVLEHERTALLFDPASDGDFDAQLHRIVEDVELRTRLAAAGRRLIDECGYTWDANVERVLEALGRKGE